jgi:hypothetical protein
MNYEFSDREMELLRRAVLNSAVFLRAAYDFEEREIHEVNVKLSGIPETSEEVSE